jgi:TatD DNase family protein
MISGKPTKPMLSSDRFIDVHRHSPAPSDCLTVLSLDTHQLVGVAPDTASKTENLVHDPAILNANGYFSLGIHPWFLAQQNVERAFDLIVQQCANPNMLAIGECGLDRYQGPSLTTQIDVFSRQAKLAKQLNKPLIVHCVRAFDELLHIKKSCETTSVWIVHGCNCKPHLATRLLEQGCYLSFGKALQNPPSHAYKILNDMPLERLFLETDAADELSIDDIYRAAATIRRLDIDTLRRQIRNNFLNVFFND